MDPTDDKDGEKQGAGDVAGGIPQPLKRKWQSDAAKRTTAVYFPTEADQRRVRKAAKAIGKPFTTFMREAALQKANEILERLIA
jgi:hypothetical protein